MITRIFIKDDIQGQINELLVLQNKLEKIKVEVSNIMATINSNKDTSLTWIDYYLLSEAYLAIQKQLRFRRINLYDTYEKARQGNASNSS